MGNLLFIFISYWVSKAAGIPTVLLRAKEMALPDVERNFFSSDYHAKRSINILRKAIEKVFGSKQSTIFLRLSAFLFLAAIACLVTLQFLYVGTDQLFSFMKNGLAVQLQPDEYDRLHSFAGSAFDKLLKPDRFFHAGYFVLVITAAFVFSYAVLSACSALAFLGVYRFVVWFSQDNPLTGSQVLLRLLRLLALILVADGIFLLLSTGTPFLLGRVVDIHPFQRADVQDWPMPDHPGPYDILIYSV